MYASITFGVLLIASGVALTQTPILRWIVLGQVETRLGCLASAESCRLNASGELVIRGLSLRLAELDGEAAEFLTARELRAEVDWGALLSGRNPLRSVAIEESLVRVSLDEQTSVVNLSLLRPRAGSGVGSGYPHVDLWDTTIELGEHRSARDPRGPGYTRLTTLDLQGQLIESPDLAGLYVVELNQLGGQPDTATRLAGEIERETGEVVLTLTGLDLAEWSSRTAPSRIREFWQTLDVRGAIDAAIFTYAPGEGLAVRLTPREVDLLVPITVPDSNEPDGARTELLAMRGVNGAIVFAQNGFGADLEGEIEDLRCRVALQYDSYDFDASYRAQIETDGFRFEGEGAFRRFAPPMVLRVVNRFMEPRADLSGFVRIARARSADGGTGRVTVQGVLNVSNGRAAYGKYPYPIGNISGRVRFTESEVELVDITGESASGARLSVTGRIWPPNDGAAVALDIRLRDLPTDDLFVRSLPENRRSVYSTIFNHEEYERLRRTGAFQSASDRREIVDQRIEIQATLDAMDDTASNVERESLRAQLAQLDALLNRPVFELGGMANLIIDIRREFGDDTEYEEVITIDFPSAGIVVDRFPYPAIAENLRLTIESGVATISPASLRGVQAGAGTIEGQVRYGQGSEYEPDLLITATDIPINGLLIQALPGRERFEQRAADPVAADAGFSVHRFLRRLNLVGTASCSAHIFTSQRSNSDYRVEVRFDGVAAHPLDVATISDARLLRFDPGTPHATAPLLNMLSGEFTITDDRLDMPRLEGFIAGSDQGDSPFRGRLAVSFPRSSEDAGIGRRLTDSIDLELFGESIDIARPLERVLDAADAGRAQVVASLRDRFSPAGELDATLTLEGDERDLRFRINTDRIADVQFDAFGGRVGIRPVRGRIEVLPESVVLHDIAGSLRFADQPSGSLRIEGSYSLADLGLGDGDAGVVSGELTGSRFEAQMLAAIAGAYSDRVAATIAKIGLSGRFDAGFTVHSGGAGTELEAVVRPREIAFLRDGYSAHFNTVEGQIGIGNSGGAIDLELHSPSLFAELLGNWSRETQGDFALETEIGVSASSYNDSVRALIPSAVRAMLAGMEMASDSPMVLSSARLSTDSSGETSFRGILEFESLDLRVGLSLKDMMGRADIQAKLADDALPEVEVGLHAAHASASGAVLSAIRASVESGSRVALAEPRRASDPPGTVYISSVSADVAGGRLAARGALRPSPVTGSLEGGLWQAEADLSGLDFGRLLTEVARDAGRAAQAPESRGLLDGNLALTGTLGDASKQRGRALLRIQPAPGRDGTEVIRLPGLIEFVKLSSLQAPVSEPIDFAYAEAFIEGATVHLHDLSAESRSVSINGSGTMRIPDLSLDLTFTTIVLRDVSLLTEIFERVRNELVTARITGTLYDPQVEIEQLTATRRLIDAIIRGEQKPSSP